MSIVINNTRYVNTEIQVNALTITYDGEDYKYMANSPILEGSALQDYVDSKESQYAYGILYGMYPGARFKQLEGNSDFDKLLTWIAAGHTNAAYATGGSPYCTIATVPAYCDGAEGDDQATCEMNGGTWIPEVPSPSTQEACEADEGTWVTVFDTETKALLAGATWTQETVIEKVPFTDSHNLTGSLVDRKLEEINNEVNAYITQYYDAGTQQSFTGIYSLRSTPDSVRDYLDPVWAWISSIMAYYYGKKQDIIDAVDANALDAITWDFTTFDASKPDVDLQTLMGT